MASRFFAASDSSSDESSEEELYSNDEASDQDDSDNDSDDDDSDSDSSSGSETGGANRFLKDAESESESDDEDVGKVLKSGKDKRFDELEATIRQVENAQKINDWAVISDRMSFNVLCQEYMVTMERRIANTTQYSTSLTAKCPRSPSRMRERSPSCMYRPLLTSRQLFSRRTRSKRSRPRK